MDEDAADGYVYVRTGFQDGTWSDPMNLLSDSGDDFKAHRFSKFSAAPDDNILVYCVSENLHMAEVKRQKCTHQGRTRIRWNSNNSNYDALSRGGVATVQNQDRVAIIYHNPDDEGIYFVLRDLARSK